MTSTSLSAMRKLSLVGAAALALSACSSGSESTSSSSTGGAGTSGSSGGSTGGTSGASTISVAGTASVHPVAALFYGAGKPLGATPPSVVGRDVRIDEPLKVLLDDPTARLGKTQVGADAKFKVDSVVVDDVIIGMVAALVAASPDGGVTSCPLPTDSGFPDGSPAYCESFITTSSTLVEKKPNDGENITNAASLGIPVAFERYLSAKLGLTPPNTLADKGWVMGYVVDATGNAVKGVEFDISVNAKKPTVQYFDDDFNPVATGGKTNKYGVFVLLAPGNPSQYSKPFPITGRSEFGCHKTGSAVGSAVALVYDAAHPGACN